VRLSLRLILFLIVGITLVTFLVARSQVRGEKRGLRADLERRAGILAESLQEIIEPALERGSHDQLRHIVERYGNRERLAGVVVYDPQGNVIAETPSLTSRFSAPPVPVKELDAAQQGYSKFFDNDGKSMAIHGYFLPLHSKSSSVIGYLGIFHDASYIEAQSVRIWREAIWHVVAQVLLIVLITVLIIRWTIILPISRTAQWMKDVRAGRNVTPPPMPKGDFLAPFAKEVQNLTESLVEARAAAEQEAHLRETGESLWTPERLRVSIQKKALQNTLFVVSNREPYMHVHKGKGVEMIIPASGLVTALEPILRACDGEWIASGSGDADRETVDEGDRLRVPPDKPEYTLKRVFLSKEEEEGYYYGFQTKVSGRFATSRTHVPFFERRIGRLIKLRTANLRTLHWRRWTASKSLWFWFRITISRFCRACLRTRVPMHASRFSGISLGPIRRLSEYVPGNVNFWTAFSVPTSLASIFRRTATIFLKLWKPPLNRAWSGNVLRSSAMAT
jgi:uncharacterized membrane protein affecting hemolysin expression